jgi:hypothetical protein
MLSGKFFSRDDLGVKRLPADLLVSAPRERGVTLHCYVDPRALVPHTYELQDEQGKVHFSLNLDDFRMIGDVPYPHRMHAESETGRIVVQFDEVELNDDLAPAAFQPARRAEKLP